MNESRAFPRIDNSPPKTSSVTYALTIFLSAFLLFQIQPLIAKTILPWFGGSAAIWAACMLFFQIALLLGYLYAHWSIGHFTPRQQTVAHIFLLCLSLLALPVIPSAWWKPTGVEEPLLRIFGLLTATIGLPYALLSATSPLLQAWFSRGGQGVLPYRFFALSNTGSILGLLSYPVLAEPYMTTRQQAWVWSGCYLVFLAFCGWAALRSRGGRISAAALPGQAPEIAPRWTLQLLWLSLAAAASALLLSVTNHMSQNIAAIPFLWVLPLTLYLLSFILCFESSRWYRRQVFLGLFAVAIGSMAYAISDKAIIGEIRVAVPLFATCLFVCCMVCHGELARLKPAPQQLTSFYLMCSMGGAAGGLFVAWFAPSAFNGFYEFPIAIGACALLILYVTRQRDPIWFACIALSFVLIFYLARDSYKAVKGARVLARNFYGALRVNDSEGSGSVPPTRQLTHGTINHGEQFLETALRRRPTTYYGFTSGVGLAIRELQGDDPMNVGVAGLGTGTLASYGRPGDHYRMYEINPMVLKIARRDFFFLHDCLARLDVALGDARLSLEREPNIQFDVLAIDAFSGDAIPVHLLTREAFALYWRHLKPDGVLAIHVSNKFLDLAPVVQLGAESVAKQARMVENEESESEVIFSSDWVLVTSRPGFFDTPLLRGKSTAIPDRPGLRPWTDDYSNLWQILK